MCCPVELQTIIAVCLILTIIRPDRPALSRNSNLSLRNTIFILICCCYVCARSSEIQQQQQQHHCRATPRKKQMEIKL